MNAVKNNKRTLESRTLRPALEIRFHFVDGSIQIYRQGNAEVAQSILRRIDPSVLFSQPRIVVADAYSKSVFVCSQINRVDLVFDDPGFSGIPYDHADLVELTEAEFNQHVPLDEPARLERREQQREAGDLLVSFLHLRMRGGSDVYVMNEAIVKLPIENHSFMQRLLSKGAYSIRLAEGGQGILNLQNLIGYTVYPGVPEIPADAWMALPTAYYETLTVSELTRNVERSSAEGLCGET
jgi:hypothetical protein